RGLSGGHKKAQNAQETDNLAARRWSDSFGPAVKHAAFDLLNATCFVLFVPLCGYLAPGAKFQISNFRRSTTVALVKLLFIADIVGEPGRRVVKQLVPQL